MRWQPNGGELAVLADTGKFTVNIITAGILIFCDLAFPQ